VDARFQNFGGKNVPSDAKDALYLRSPFKLNVPVWITGNDGEGKRGRASFLVAGVNAVDPTF